ncbi:MAG: hypothetical protein RSB55_06955 [Oscillospiraceae bacterium]
MSDDFDKLNSGELTVDDILAEFSPGKTPGMLGDVPAAEDAGSEAGSEKTPEPVPEAAAEKVSEAVLEVVPKKVPKEATRGTPAEKPAVPAAKRVPKKAAAAQKGKDNVIEFPQEDRSVTGRIERLVKQADDYADTMFAREGQDPEEAEREALLPGVDWEDSTRTGIRQRKPRKPLAPPPDRSPAELEKRYGRGLRFLWTRTLLTFLPTLALFYLTAAQELPLYLPPILTESLQIYLAVGLLAVSMLLGADVLAHGIAGIFTFHWGADSLVVLGTLATLADGLLLPTLQPEGGRFPYCVVGSCCMFFCLWGKFLKKRALRQTCRVAAAVGEPYAVTLDERKWNGRDAFCKWEGSIAGYGSQVQAPDGAQRAYWVAAPLLALTGVLFALLASVGGGHPERFLWCLSANLTAAASFSGLLCFAAPCSSLSRRLAKCGGALGGWDGIRRSRGQVSAVLTDGDLFPPGAVKMNGVKVFEPWTLPEITSYAATLIRASASGLEKPFHDLLHSQGGVFRRCNGLLCHEGGLTAGVDGRQIIVGTAAFLTLMKIELPQGLSVKNAVFCAVDGRLSGIFALQYKLHDAVRPSLNALIRGRISPVLATRDFNVIPAMLRQKFKLPEEKMEFPNLDRRLELSEKKGEHTPLFAALLCREGLAPFAETVVGGKRLVTATRISVFFAVLGSAAGLLLAFYLTFVGAPASLSPMNLLLFLLLWTVPTALISGWVDRY